MPTLRLIAWNCHHGRLAHRVSLLKPLTPDLVFLQECQPAEPLPLLGTFGTRRINPKKGIALGSVNPHYRLTDLGTHPNGGRAVIAGEVAGPVAFTLLGIWSVGPRYVDDVLSSLAAYDDVLRSGRAVVMGDMNSGPTVNDTTTGVTKKHQRLLDAFAARGLVSAYHVFHKVKHGEEAHATYRHRFNAAEPWHLDFCFIPQSWAASLTSVELLDGDYWRAESDHHPLMVDLRFN
jgi:exodeoxyribonuclease III